MKKLFLSILHLSVITTLISGNANAQTSQSKLSFKSSEVTHSDVDPNNLLAPNYKAGIRASKDFNKNFKQATNVLWNFSGEVLVASFKENNIQKRVMYLKNGHWIRTLIYYDENGLPSHVKSLVNSNYRKFNISGVTEVHENNMIAYFINIETAKELKQVIFYDDIVWTHMEYKKS